MLIVKLAGFLCTFIILAVIFHKMKNNINKTWLKINDLSGRINDINAINNIDVTSRLEDISRLIKSRFNETDSNVISLINEIDKNVLPRHNEINNNVALWFSEMNKNIMFRLSEIAEAIDKNSDLEINKTHENIPGKKNKIIKPVKKNNKKLTVKIL